MRSKPKAAKPAKVDRRLAAADLKTARETHARMIALTKRLTTAAAQIKAGSLTSTAALDSRIGKALRADLEEQGPAVRRRYLRQRSATGSTTVASKVQDDTTQRRHALSYWLTADSFIRSESTLAIVRDASFADVAGRPEGCIAANSLAVLHVYDFNRLLQAKGIAVCRAADRAGCRPRAPAAKLHLDAHTRAA